MSAWHSAHAAVSVTTLDKSLAAKMEPRASAPDDRLRAIRELSEAGVPVIVMTAPIIPGLNDHEVASILEAARDAGALVWAWAVMEKPASNAAAIAILKCLRIGDLLSAPVTLET